MMYLTREERKLIAQTVVRHTSRRVPVFVHGAWSQADTIQLDRHVVEIGADGIGMLTPAYLKLSDHGLVDFYRAVAVSVPCELSYLSLQHPPERRQ